MGSVDSSLATSEPAPSRDAALLGEGADSEAGTPRKVYLVMLWDYSNTAPQAIFSTYERAQVYADECNAAAASKDGFDVEEFTVDDEPSE